MPDSIDSTSSIPPKGDEKKAEKYINQLSQLLDSDKLTVFHTDLNRFDPSSLYDHYRMDLKDYQVEVSHSKKADTGEDAYVIIFTNLKQVQTGTCEKVILAYVPLTRVQFINFKTSADEQLERIKRIAEEKRFKEVMQPIDNVLSELTDNSENTPKEVSETTPEENRFVSQNPAIS